MKDFYSAVLPWFQHSQIILQQLSHTAIGWRRKKVLKQHQTYPSEIPAFSRRKQGKIVLLLLFWPAEWNKEKHLPITFLAVMFSTSKMEWQQRRKNNRIQLLRHLRFPWLYSWQASVFSSDKHFNLDGELRDMAALQAFRDAPTWCLARTLHHSDFQQAETALTLCAAEAAVAPGDAGCAHTALLGGHQRAPKQQGFANHHAKQASHSHVWCEQLEELTSGFTHSKPSSYPIIITVQLFLKSNHIIHFTLNEHFSPIKIPK